MGYAGLNKKYYCLENLIFLIIRNYDLEEKLINFAVGVLELTDSLTGVSFGANHIANQLARSGTSPALNYGEAQGAESQADFLNKIKIVLKELRESSISLKILFIRNYISNNKGEQLLKENNELIAIFTKSTDTTRKNIFIEKTRLDLQKKEMKLLKKNTKL